MKIQTLSLTDFRAFPGPAPTTFELEGKNLLVYGENGSGKSSLFHALRGFFSPAPPPDLRSLKNSFSKASLEHLAVNVVFDDGTFERWGMALQAPRRSTAGEMVGPFIEHLHPVHRASGQSTAVRSAARMASCLDYRSLLATNYKNDDGPVNLFEPVVSALLADYFDLGANKTIAQLWKLVQESVPTRNTGRQIGICLQACTTFNTALRTALSRLLIDLNQLLPKLSASGVQVEGFDFPGVTYLGQITDLKMLGTKQIGLKLNYRGVPLDRPQNYLNEARLSALGLALYLAGRLACAPRATPHLKLLVLDDVLVGLDHSNRMPVLNVLKDYFSEWQIVLLTHDRGWFDLARQHLPSGWTCYEVYEGDQGATAPIPIVRKTLKRPAPALLQKARELLAQGYVEAAANYVRQAFETGLRAACELKSIKLPYKQDLTDHKAQDLLNGLKTWSGSLSVPKANWDAALQQLELMKDVVMNPYSHPSAPNIPRQEVVDAADAVDAFLTLARTR